MQVVILLSLTIIIPMVLSGARLAIIAPQIIFWPAKGYLKVIFAILTFLTAPLHSLILPLKHFHTKLKIWSKPTRELLNENDEIHYHLCMSNKLELGLETISQLFLQLILLLYATTETRTTEGLSNVFDKELSLQGELEKDAKIIFLYVSIGFSLLGCVMCHMNCLSAKRIYFPTISKGVIAIYTFLSISTKIVATIAFFTPCLGLFSTLGHWKGELFSWSPDIIENYVTNKTIIFENTSPIPVENVYKHFKEHDLSERMFWSSFISSERYEFDLPINAAFLDKLGHTTFTINGTIQFGNSSEIPWNRIDRTLRNINGKIIQPSYIIYTIFSMKEYLFIFIALWFIHAILIYIVKNNFSRGFERLNILEKFIHCWECTNIPYHTEEWDSSKGDAQAHIQRMQENRIEGIIMMLVNLMMKLVLLIPLCVLGNHRWTRFIAFMQSVRSLTLEQHHL